MLRRLRARLPAPETAPRRSGRPTRRARTRAAIAGRAVRVGSRGRGQWRSSTDERASLARFADLVGAHRRRRGARRPSEAGSAERQRRGHYLGRCSGTAASGTGRRSACTISAPARRAAARDAWAPTRLGRGATRAAARSGSRSASGVRARACRPRVLCVAPEPLQLHRARADLRSRAPSSRHSGAAAACCRW